ncbi:MAG: Imm53 family immunity protein [Victivallaceae bacterium]|nr:Imm53 family immunity protein [Victivallaceae bacterium]
MCIALSHEMKAWSNYLYMLDIDNRFEIHSLENPGWFLFADLHGTDFENTRFTPIISNINANGSESDEYNWLSIYVDEDHVFNGCGSLNKLDVILSIFFSWLKDNGFDPKKYESIQYREPAKCIGGFNIWNYCNEQGYTPIVDKY